MLHYYRGILVALRLSLRERACIDDLAFAINHIFAPTFTFVFVLVLQFHYSQTSKTLASQVSISDKFILSLA